MILRALGQINIGTKGDTPEVKIHKPGDEFRCADKEMAAKLVRLGVAVVVGGSGLTDQEKSIELAKREIKKATRTNKNKKDEPEVVVEDVVVEDEGDLI